MAGWCWTSRAYSKQRYFFCCCGMVHKTMYKQLVEAEHWRLEPCGSVEEKSGAMRFLAKLERSSSPRGDDLLREKDLGNRSARESVHESPISMFMWCRVFLSTTPNPHRLSHAITTRVLQGTRGQWFIRLRQETMSMPPPAYPPLPPPQVVHTTKARNKSVRAPPPQVQE